MKELTTVELEAVNGGMLFLIPFTPAIATGVAVGAATLGATAVGTFVGLRALFKDM